MNVWFRVFYIVLALLPATLHAHTSATSDDITRGLAWLSSQQQADGSFRSNTMAATDWQASTEALQAFASAGQQDHLNTQTLATYLAGLNAPETELLSRRISANLRLGQPFADDLATLALRQNSDGGFGDENGFDSSVYDTLFALQVLANAGNRASPATSAAIGFLLSQQRSDGSFALDSDTASSAYITALTLRAVTPYLYVYNVGESLNKGQEYLYSLSAANGSWQSDWQAALFLLAVVPLTTDVTRYANTLSWLKLQQQGNGSWQDDAFTTALAVQALYLSANISLPTAPDKATVRGRTVDAVSAQPLANVRITTSPLSATDLLSDAQGSFVLNGLEEGSYRLTYEADGYLTASQTLNVKAGQLIDLGDIRLNLAPTSSLVRGVVSDANTGLPVAQALVQVTLAGTTTDTLTAVDGSYQLSSGAGSASLMISASGYHGVSASANLVAGSAAEFSVQLQPDSEPTVPLQLSGRVLDATTGQPLADVQAEQMSNASAVLSGSDGRFTIPSPLAGEQQIMLSRPGYDSVLLSVVVPATGRAALGDILLTASEPVSTTRITGRITDADSGAAIEGAQVSVFGSSTTSDSNGFYQLDGITSLEFVIGANATGYVFGSAPVSLSQPRALTMDIALMPANAGGILVSQVTTGQPAYGAYQRVALSTTLTNLTVRERRLLLYVLITDNNNQILDRFPGADLPALPDTDNAEAWEHYKQHLSDATEVLAPNESRHVELAMSWNSGRQAPGQYRVTIQALDADTSQVLAEAAAALVIEPTQALPSLAAEITPAFALLDSNADLTLGAVLRNASNVPVDASLSWTLADPDNQILSSGRQDLQITPEQTNLQLTLENLQQQISRSGNYPLTLTLDTTATQGTPEAAQLFVPPTVRLQVEQDLTPQQLIPGAERRSQVRILIKGVDGE